MDQPALGITVRSMPRGRIVVFVDGEIDVGTASQLTSAIDGIDLDGCRDVVVDLAAVGYMGVRGLRALLEARLALADLGVDFSVAHPHQVVRRLLEMTGTSDLLLMERRAHRKVVRFAKPERRLPARRPPVRPTG